MLEFFLIRWLAGKVGDVLRGKGRRPGWFQFLFVMLWIFGEFGGLVAGLVLELDAGAYFLAIVGAGAATGAAFAIAHAAKPSPEHSTQVGAVFE